MCEYEGILFKHKKDKATKREIWARCDRTGRNGMPYGNSGKLPHQNKVWAIKMESHTSNEKGHCAYLVGLIIFARLFE